MGGRLEDKKNTRVGGKEREKNKLRNKRIRSSLTLYKRKIKKYD